MERLTTPSSLLPKLQTLLATLLVQSVLETVTYLICCLLESSGCVSVPKSTILQNACPTLSINLSLIEDQPEVYFFEKSIHE